MILLLKLVNFQVMLDIPSEVPLLMNCFIMTVHCCVFCDANQGSLSLGISNITLIFKVK